MGFLSGLKQTFSGNKKTEEIDSTVYLVNTKNSLKHAHDALSNFLEGVKDFRPARRHEQLYSESVYGKVTLVKAWLQKSIDFVDGRLGNSMDSVSSIKNLRDLSNLINDWTKVIKIEQVQPSNIPTEQQKGKVVYYSPNSPERVEENTEEKVPEDVYSILKVEMWSEKRTSRGFPAPQNKTLLFNHLDNAFSRLKEAKFNLEEYHMRSANNSGD